MAIVKGAKKGKGEARKPVVAPDSAQSKTYIKILYGLGEGEIEGLANGNQSIFLEGTPLQDANGNLNYSNVKLDFRKGTNDQDYIEGFPSVESETAVDVELKSGAPWVRAFNNIDLDAVRIRLKWGPLRQQDSSTGDVSGITIEYAIDIQTDGGAWTEVLKTKISDKTSANYERAHRIDLPKADSGWLIRVRRITPNSTSEFVSDKMYVEAFTEVVDAKLRYPNTALLGLQYDAETFGNVAKLAVDLKGRLLLVPTNYNPQTRQYTGIWDGTFKRAYTNNPAWIYYDLCTNDRYGLGNRLTPFMIDKWSLYRLAQYCDQSVSDGLGGQEPRFTCNVYIQNAEDAFSILMKLAGVFRAIAFWDGTSIICDADIPQDTYFTYTRANVVGGVFEYSGTRARDRHNVVKVAWDNPANHYKTEYEFVRDENAIAESGQVRILELDAWGCTSRGQAQRAGHWALKSEQKETRTVSFKVGLDGHIPLPGRVIEIADELFAGRANGGRVSKISADLKSITIDRDDVIAKAGDRLVINGENGKAQTRIVQSISGRVITVTLPFDENSIAVQNVWVLDAQDLATMKFRVISISQEEKHQFSITALQYNPQKFDEIDNGAFFEDAPISIINPSIQEPVKDVLITTESRVDQGINITTMIVSWMQAKGAVKYLVEWRKDDGSWIRLPQTGNNSVEVPGVYSGQYQARVTAISAFEIASLPVTSSLTEITGKQGLPPKIAFIRATGILFGMKLDWGFPPTGAKDTAYTEIEVSPDGINNIAQLGLFAYPTTTTTIQGLQPNLRQFYRGRLIDRIGNVGPWSEWVNGTTTADPEAVLDLISGHINESDLAQELQGKIENSVDVSEAAQAAANNAQAVASSAQTAANNAQAVASEAKTAASSAQSAATTAQTQASSAQKIANDASVIATNAKNTADQAAEDASSAITAAAEAKTTATNANTTATNAQTTANNASSAASKVASDLTTSTNQLNKKIADETDARTAAISKLNDGLTTETSQRKSEDAALLNNIETYKSSTNGTLSSLQTQINTNATNTSANTSKISSLDSRLTTNEGKTADAINAAATAQQTANTAVTNAAAAASAVTSLKSELSTGKGINNIIAPFSDPQELSPYIIGASRTVALVKSPMRIKGNAYDVTFNAVAGSIYFGSSSLATVNTAAAGVVSGGKRYMLSAYLKNLDATKQADVYFTLHWFKRAANGTFTASQSVLLNQATNNTRVTPSNDGGTISCKAVAAPPDAVAFAVICSGNGVYNVAGSRILIDMLMLEEVVGVDVPASTWTAGPTDLSAIKSALDANASAIQTTQTKVDNIDGRLTTATDSITSLNSRMSTAEGNINSTNTAVGGLSTRMATAEGKITNQSDSIASLQNSVTSINGTLANKADSSAVNNLTSRVETAEGKISSQSGQITSLSNSLDLTSSNLNDVNVLARLLSLGKPLRDDPTFKTTSAGGLSAYNFPAGTSWIKQAKSTDNPTGSTNEMLIKATQALGGGWYPTSPTLVLTANKTFLIKQIIKMPVGTKLQAIGNATGTGGYIRILGNDLGTGKFETYYSVVQGGADLSGSTIQGHFRVIAGTNPPVPTVDNPVFVILASYEVFDVTAVNDTIPKAYSDAIAANANAINTLSNTVTQQGNTITSQSNSITTLTNKITNNDLSNLVLNPDFVDPKSDWTSGVIVDATDAAPNPPSPKALRLNNRDSYYGPFVKCNVGDMFYVSAWFATPNTSATASAVLGFNTRNSAGTYTWYSVAIKSTDKNAWGMVEGYFTVPNGMVDIRPWLQVSIAASEAAGQQWHVTNIQVRNITGNKKLATDLQATSSALSTLDSKVTNIDGRVTSASNNIVSLNNSVTNINATLAQKADATALNSLSNRVTNAEGNITSQGNSITQLNNSVTSINGELTKKADATALNALTNRVSTAEGTITSQGNSITSLRNDLNATNDKVSSKADSSALNSLDSKVTSIDGRVTSNTSAVTSLQGRVSTVEGGLSSKADASALNNYYTKTEADSATSGAIDKFNSQLTIGGVNVVANSEAPRTSTAATNKEYLLYERSAELKTFYDENLEKPITISFEMSVPVAGPVQVYSSNGSAHQFVTSVNAIIVNQFAKYSVTVSPKAHTASTTVSTIEFYGTYGTGRIPTIRKLQIEAGTKATAWSPSPRDTKAAIDANASAIQTTQTKVDNIDGRLTTATDSITSLNSRMSTAEGNINSTNTAVGGLSTRMATAEGKITNQSDSIASLQNSVTSINGTLANKADSSAVNNLTSRVETAEGKISSQSGQITSLSNSLDLTSSNLNDVNVLARLLSLGKPLRDDPTFKTTSAGGLSAYNFPAGTSWIKQAKSTDNPTGSTNEMLIKATQALGGGWYPTSPTLVLTANKTFLIKQIIKMPVGTKLQAIGNATGTGGYIRILGNDLGTGKFETYYSVVQGGADLSGSTIQGHFRVIAGTNPPVPTVDNPVFVILASYEVFDVTAVNDTIPKAYSDAIAANANAINTLSNTVTQQGNTITSQSNSITTLTNKITNNDLSNLVLNPDFVDPKSDWTSGVIVDATDAAPNPPSPKALRLNNRDSYYGPFVKCNVGDMFYVSAWFATPNTSATASAVLGFNTRNSAGTYTWYSVAIKSTDKNAWGMVEGYFTVPNGMVDIRPWLQVSIAASEAAGQQWHVTNIQVRNITGNKKLATDLQATSSALSTLDSKVTNIDGRVTSASNNIVSLNNSVTNINATLAQKADATALNSLSNRVTNAEGNITSQGNSITSLTNSLAVSGKGGTNLLIKSNVVGLYDGVSYPHHTYKLGEDWEIGAKYTLIWCAEHKRGTGDNNSYLAVYAGGGSQTLQSIVNTDGKVISKVTFVKNSAVASGPIIHFYMINRPTADKGTIGTVYWAVLVKGDVLTTDAWIPSPYDYIPDSNANAAAITNLTNTVTQQGNTLTSHTNSITSLDNSITSINGILNTKANTSAVSDLDSRVTDAEGKITANTSSITSLTANLKSTSNGITMSASIDVDPDSEWIYWTKNGEVARADDTTALGGKVYRFGNNAGNDHVNARSKAKLPFDQNKTYRIRARYRRVSGTGTVYCAVFGIAKDGVSHVNSSNTVTTDAGSSNYFVTNQAPALNAWQEVTVYVKGRAAGAATGGWTLDNPRQLPNATAFISVQFLANYSSAAGEVDLDYLIIEDADAIAANDATAKALSSLDTRVTTAEGKITSQGNSITQLNNSITTINGTLSTKADSSALTNLANRVTTAENSITSQGSSITSLNSSVTGILKDIEVTDTRSTNQPPSWYWSNYPKRIVREFKQASTIGLSGMGTYVSLETYVYYSDATGGPIIQIARGTDSKLTAERRSTSTSTWGTWVQDIKAISDGLANKAEASALSSLDSKVSVIDGKVSTQASSITTLQTTVGGNTASIQSQQQSIDGLKARATLKLQSGNLVGGVGIENDSKTVDFIIQANKFAIGAPSTVSGSVTPKYAFVYQSTATTLPNGTVIPAGLYLDSASISYINANKIYADSLSAISANLGTFTSLADQSKPNGARTVISGERIEVYDENNVMRVRIGRW
ncbi:phage tail protein [Acinetobacter baumannii]|nr:phage tail protein [Acinetobacter baumannii]MCE6326632.1 phage tail protein [Acinetobacter baumannii]MCE6751405.1 phage tail protein [Acinetobacter baumannii]MCE6759040.1 phage tail protein [Acinetobacter baumannii]